MIVDIARRGLSHPNAVAYVKRSFETYPDNKDGPDVPAWGIVLVYVTFMVGIVGISLVSYMLNEVITALCMIESPTAAITVSPSTTEPASKHEKESLLETGPTITLVNKQPITSSIRGTITHLVAHAGRWSRFRGLRIHFLHSMLFSLTSTFLSAALPHFPGQMVVVAALSGAAVANVHAAWTHKVVSMPSSQSFLQRIPSKSDWKILAGPAAIQAAMPYISIYLTCAAGMMLGLHKLDSEKVREYNGAQSASLIVRGILLFVFAVSCTLFLCLPAIVTLVRIEASLVSEDTDTIVPFDRSFGGKVVSQMMGGSGKVGFVEAWRSFNWEARRRLIKLFVKSFFIVAGLAFVMVHVLLAEVFVVMGPAMGEFLRRAQAEAGGM